MYSFDTLPKGRVFTLGKTDHLKGKKHEASDKLVLDGKAEVGDIIQVTTYTIKSGEGKGTYFTNDVEVLKEDPNDPQTKVRWLKTDLNAGHIKTIKLLKRKQSLTTVCRKAKALKRALVAAGVGNATIKDEIKGDIELALDYCSRQFQEGVDILTNKSKPDQDTVPVF